MNIGFVNEAREAAKHLHPFKEFLAKTFGKKLYLCHEGPEKHEFWTGQLPFYLFWCSACEHWAKDYPHGYPERQRLHCSNCNERYSFIQLKTKFSMAWEFVKFLRAMWKMRKEHPPIGGGGTGPV